MHSILQSISSGSQCAHIWHSSFENPFFSVWSTLGIHFILFRINKFSLLLLAFGWTFSYSTQTYTHMLMLTPTSTRTHIIYPIFCRCFVSRKCSFVFRLMILALEHTIELLTHSHSHIRATKSHFRFWNLSFQFIGFGTLTWGDNTSRFGERKHC